ncbi:MAG: outer spore coat protein CotE [Bacilli bacterium]|nr:outer spore coat protein CotE [Bacilli bacterium]
MNNYREIVTKAVVSKGKKLFTSTNTVTVNNPSTILGCWVINHNFNGVKEGNKIIIDGSYDVNIWYSYDNDTKTDVIRETNKYSEVINMRDRDNTSGEEIIVRSLKQPNCVKVDIDNNNIVYTIEKELGIELVGDIKVKIEANLEEDPWDEIVEENTMDEINEDFIEESL